MDQTKSQETCPNSQGIKSYGLGNFMAQGEIVGHFPKFVIFIAIFKGPKWTKCEENFHKVEKHCKTFPKSAHLCQNSKI